MRKTLAFIMLAAIICMPAIATQPMSDDLAKFAIQSGLSRDSIQVTAINVVTNNVGKHLVMIYTNAAGDDPSTDVGKVLGTWLATEKDWDCTDLLAIGSNADGSSAAM